MIRVITLIVLSSFLCSQQPLKYGYTLYPTITFGEEKVYKYVNAGKIKFFLNKLKIPAIVFW